ncbi:MAG: 4-hydroxy-3-methylbut-2-enyl diphosphate reductase [Bacteroidales bacterium]|nr:4-hydroxy-3-methylbut-2-enyl diphosphate reductase [Bacteroidales bacterium]
MKINIDPYAGFCFGVTKVVDTAEEILHRDHHLYCLGDIVHNAKEIERLKNLGLEIISYDQFLQLSNCKVLIRAHGEPPETYRQALVNNIKIVDGTCPIVLKLQSKIEEDYAENRSAGVQIAIYGRKDHAEVRGLAGQTGNNCIILESEKDLDKIDYHRSIFLYAQTTMNPDNFEKIISEIRKRLSEAGIPASMMKCTNSICGQVSGRIPRLKKFCQENDIIIFGSSKKSSNGRLLFRQCKNVCEKTYFVSETSEIDIEWLSDARSIGITGATSTPRWFLEEIAAFLHNQLTSS